MNIASNIICCIGLASIHISMIAALCRDGLTDDLGAEAMMMEALEKVEQEIKQPLMRNDKKGMALLMAEFDRINKKWALIACAATLCSNLFYFKII